MDQGSGRADARANRERLLHAAHELFRERGIDAEMKEIAERAGVGIGTIYRNFPTKDDLLVAIVGELVGTIRATIDAALAVANPIEALRTLLRGGIETAERFGDIAMALHGELPPGCKEQFEELNPQELMGSVVQKGIDAGLFRADLDPELAGMMVSAVFVPWNYHALRPGRTADELIDAFLALFLHGALRPRMAGEQEATARHATSGARV